MEFLLYLSPTSQEIYQMISRKVRVVENAPICRQHDIWGWYNANANTMTICTTKIKNSSNFREYLNETFLHESTHIAQACSNGFYRGIRPFGISLSQMHLSQNRLEGLEASVQINGESIRNSEREAFWFENKPDKVRYVVQKYCF